MHSKGYQPYTLYNLSHPSSRICVRALYAAGLLTSLRLTAFPPFGSGIMVKRLMLFESTRLMLFDIVQTISNYLKPSNYLIRVTAAGLSRIHTGFPFNSAFAETVIHYMYVKSAAKLHKKSHMCKSGSIFFENDPANLTDQRANPIGTVMKY